MRCEDVLTQLNARADGELSAADADGLDAHLSVCSQCKVAAEGLQTLDAELRRAFGPRREGAARLAERTVAMIRVANNAPVTAAPHVSTPHRWAWGQTLLGLAAGFLLAVALFRPWEGRSHNPDTAQPLPPIAHALAQPDEVPPISVAAMLACASGPVEVRPINVVPTFTCPVESPIERDSVVRTGANSRCELCLHDGNAVRLDVNSEVTLHKSELIEVNHGRVWACSEPGRKGLEVQTGGGKIIARDAAQLAVDCQGGAARLIVIGGEVDVQTGQTSTLVGAGKQVRIVHGKLEDNPGRCDALLETSWVNSVLALRNDQDPELAERVNQLLANVGAAKLSLLYEDELRRLGDDGVAPLLAYLASTHETPHVSQRATAARIVADVAQTRWIEDLLGLLTDESADVRFHAARGLERLTGRDQGFTAQSWQKPLEECVEPYQRWLEWWEANCDRYPAAIRNTPTAGLPPLLGSGPADHREGEAPAEP